MKLNIGCGTDLRRGYVNMDIRPIRGATQADMLKGLPLSDAIVTEVLALDFLEHFLRLDLRTRVLPELRRVMASGARLFARLPDLDRMVSDYTSGAVSAYHTARRIHGGQDYDTNIHYWSYTEEAIAEVLIEAGFEHVKRVGTINWNMEVEAFAP